MVDPGPRAVELSFENGNRARCVDEGAGDDAGSLIARVGLAETSGAVIVVCGGAGGLENGQLDRAVAALGPAVARAAAASQAAVVDGGTESGVMSVVGEARGRDPQAIPVLVGVAPRGKVRGSGAPTPLEPHHSHFVLADSAEWGGETDLLFRVAAAMAAPERVVVVLAGGGDHARQETVEAVRRGWPIVVVEGFGGFADEVAAAVRWPRWLRWLRGSGARKLAGYQGAGVCPADAAELAGRLTWELSARPALRHAWRTYTAYEALANGLRRQFVVNLRLIIVLGIAATGMALLDDGDDDFVRWTTTVLTTVVALLIAGGGRRAIGKRWILLRAAAEAIKAETFRYRTGTAPYRAELEREAVLAGRLEVIDKQLLSGEAGTGVVSQPVRPGPPGGLDRDSLDDLDATRYAQDRTADQIAYYRRRVRSKTWWRTVLQLLTLVAGAAGTIVAAAGKELLVALTTAVSAGAASYLTSLQHERDIVVFNQSAADLDAVRVAWLANRPGQEDREGLERLVERTEAILTDEVGAWARRMARTLDDEAHRQEKEAARA